MKKSIFILIAFLFLACMPAMATAYTYGGHSYELTSQTMTWTEANAYAQSTGGWLVTINDQNEQEWLESTFGTSSRYWIGFNDRDIEGTWVWANGETPGYTNWDSGEPNNASNEDAAVMNWGSSGAWNDWSTSHSVYAIIESPVPVPSAAWLLGVGLISMTAWRRRHS